MSIALFLSVFLIAACGLIYELIAGTLASYLLGDTVFQFSTIIGCYLFAMGIGSYLSRFLHRGLVARFVTIELMVGVVGGFSSSILFLAFAYTEAFRFILYAVVILVGTLVGLEIPLLMRILKERFQFRELVSHVLTFDYLGALGASLLFPILLVPKLGLVRSALVFGIFNVVVALWSTYLFREQIGRSQVLRAGAVVVLALLGTGMIFANRISSAADNSLYADEVIFSRNTPYQRIVLTKWKDDLRLFLNSHLQFSSRDEYRYHEALVHPGLAALPGAHRVLVLGGGDGLAVREILKYPSVESVTLVDLDPEMTHLFSTHPVMSALNLHSLTNPRVHVINADALRWLDDNTEQYDFIVADFPDPTSYALGKLFTTTFYRLAAKHLASGGLIVVQSTSPLFARKSYWCIVESVKQAGLRVYPYHVYVPSFGEWGYVIGSFAPYEPPKELPAGLRFLSTTNVAELFIFPVDMQPVPAEPNRLNDQVLVRYYEQEWKDVAHLVLSRREFLGAPALIGLWRKTDRKITGGFVNDSFPLGHRLRDRASFRAPARQLRVPIVIVGGGMAGLNAAWHLDKRDFRDFVILEMEQQAGGNSRWGENEISKFPWAAHYVPVPAKGESLARELFEELGLFRDGKWDERRLCFDPQERLFINGHWQEGIEPEDGATQRDRAQYRRFMEKISEFRATGQFTVPMEGGAKPSPLDRMSMADWLAQQGFDSIPLRWYINYACRDDYGALSKDTSAWAGVQYFASREPEEKGPLTWPEGNGWIAARLIEKLKRYLHTSDAVYRIAPSGNTIRVLTEQTEYIANAVVWAAPTFLASYIIEGAPRAEGFQYSPWLTANLTLDRIPGQKNDEPAWDNVIYDSPTLGYVNATHMNLATHIDRTVWTFYWSLAEHSPNDARRLLLAQDWNYWKEAILNDLARAHPDIRQCVAHMDIMRIGHAMARPAPGFIFSEERKRWLNPLGNIFFANSDLSGFSIFEEAQYRGVEAAKRALHAVSRG